MKKLFSAIALWTLATSGVSSANIPSFDDLVTEANQVMKDTVSAGEALLSGTGEKTSDKATEKKEKLEEQLSQLAPEKISVPEAIKDMQFLCGKPNLKAEYYIYLSSASWCPPCRAIMPDVVKEYKKMKNRKVEIILLGCDYSEDGVENYVKKYRAKFPAIWIKNEAITKLPGFTPPPTIPRIIIVTKDGERIHEGSGASIFDWEELTIKRK